MADIILEFSSLTLLELFTRLDRIENLIVEKSTIQDDQSEELLSTEEAAVYLKVKKATVYMYISKGIIPFMKRGKKCYFLKEDLLNFLKEGRKKSFTEIEREAATYLKNTKSK